MASPKSTKTTEIRIVPGILGGGGLGVILGMIFPNRFGGVFVDMISGILDGL